jgi:cobalt-zinc-cadmium efflux system protein
MEGRSMKAHDHDRSDLPPVEERSRLVWAIIITSVIFVAELVGGYFSGSLALISDASHMFVDNVSLAFSLIAMVVAARPVTDTHTYGFKRVEILAALVNGVLLLLVCASIAYEGVQRLIHPHPVQGGLMLGIACIGIVANVVSAVLLRHARSLNVRSAFLHVLGDLFSSIGVVIGAVAILVWNLVWLDAALSIVISVVVLASAYRLSREAVGVLMEAAPGDVDATEIRARLKEFPSVLDVHDLHVWTITSGLPALSCHVVLAEHGTTEHDTILQELASLIAREFGIAHTTIQIETAGYPGVDNACVSC